MYPPTMIERMVRNVESSLDANATPSAQLGGIDEPDYLWPQKLRSIVSELEIEVKVPAKIFSLFHAPIGPEAAVELRTHYQQLAIDRIEGIWQSKLAEQQHDSTLPQQRKCRHDPNMEARDKWLYTEWHQKTLVKTIISTLKTKAATNGWRKIATSTGIHKAVESYAEKHDLPFEPRYERELESV